MTSATNVGKWSDWPAQNLLGSTTIATLARADSTESNFKFTYAVSVLSHLSRPRLGRQVWDAK